MKFGLRTCGLSLLLWSSGCNPDGSSSTGTGASSSGATDAGSAGSTSTGTDGAGSSTAPTTGAGSTTGDPGACAPSQEPIPEDEFAVRYAEAICAQKEACGCEVDFGCAGVLKQGFQAIVDYAVQQGLAYDPACAAHVLAVTVTTRGCALRSEYFDAYVCYQDCQIFQGDVPPGGACPSEQEREFSLFVDSCAGEERCQDPDDVCGIEASAILHEGDECISLMTGPLGKCEDGTACNFDTLKCSKLVGEGESCAGDVLCEYPGWCNAQSVCQARLDAGEPCETWSQCNSWRCSGGMCADTVVVCEVDEPDDLLDIPVP